MQSRDLSQEEIATKGYFFDIGHVVNDEEAAEGARALLGAVARPRPGPGERRQAAKGEDKEEEEDGEEDFHGGGRPLVLRPREGREG